VKASTLFFYAVGMALAGLVPAVPIAGQWAYAAGPAWLQGARLAIGMGCAAAAFGLGLGAFLAIVIGLETRTPKR
jgi:hypothetical protein